MTPTRLPSPSYRLTVQRLLSTASVLAILSTNSIAIAGSVSSSVAGDVDFTTDVDHSITNSGVVTGTNQADQELILISPAPYNGTFTNAGRVEINGFSTSSAAGIASAGQVDGTIVNSGSIKIDVFGTSSSFFYADGINTVSVSGAVRNSGQIEMSNSAAGASTVSLTGMDAGSVSGVLENSGTIHLSPTGASFATGTGIDVSTINGGRVENSGTITINGTGSSSAYGIGMNASSNSGTLRNSGTIDIDLISNGTSAQGTGINTFLSDGTIENTGTIDIRAQSASYASVEGVRSIFPSDGLVIRNTGTIRLQANAGSSARAIGVSLSTGGLNLENSGTLTVSAIGNTSAVATGIRLGSGSTTTASAVKNSGSVEVSAKATAGGADATGITLGLQDGDSFTNSGSLSVSAMGSQADVRGVSASFIGETNTSVVNSGSITVSAAATASSISMIGLRATGSTSGLIENSGTVTVTTHQQAVSHNSAEGIYISTNLKDGAVFRNSGAVTVDANGGTGGATGATFVSSQQGSLIENSGTIAVNVSGGSLDASGLIISNANGTATHSGTITVDGTGTSGDVVGLSWRGNPTATLVVTGDISVKGGTGTTKAIQAGASTATIELHSTATIEGDIEVSGHNVVIKSTTGSGVYAFQDQAVGSTTFITEVVDGGSDWYVENAGTAAPTYVTLGDEKVGSNPTIMTEAVNLINIMPAKLGFGPSGSLDISRDATAQSDVSDRKPYIELQYQNIDFGTLGAADELSSNLFGLSGGVTGNLDDGGEFALGGGFFTASGNSGSADFDLTGLYLGYTSGRDWNDMRVIRGLGVGGMSVDQSRSSAGATPAASDFSSYFVTGHVGIEKDLAFGKATITPFADARYTHFFSDGYTETGGATNATVDERSFGVANLRLGGTFLSRDTGYGQFSASIAATYQAIMGEEQQLSIFGQPGVISSSDETRFGQEINVGYTKQLEAGELSLGGTLGLYGGGDKTLNLTAKYAFTF